MAHMNKCPVCVEQGLRSSFFPDSGALTTAMATHSYYDEDGNRHFHDPNTSSSGAHCSQGHIIRTHWKRACPSCHFGADSEGWRRDEDAERRAATPSWTYVHTDDGWDTELRMPPCPPDVERPDAPPKPETLTGEIGVYSIPTSYGDGTVTIN